MIDTGTLYCGYLGSPNCLYNGNPQDYNNYSLIIKYFVLAECVYMYYIVCVCVYVCTWLGAADGYDTGNTSNSY